MQSDLARARAMLDGGGCTCVLCRGDETVSSAQRGVRPLLELLDSGRELAGFSAADKAVGKAAAAIYVLLGVKAVYAPLMSEPALALLESHGIQAVYGALCPLVRNRADTGPCPMEAASMDADTPRAVLAAVRERLKTL